MRFYLALDGTKDVTQATRCERAALVGKFCSVCLLPEGKDPDELTSEQWEQIEGESRPVLDEYCDLVAHLVDDHKRVQLDKLRESIAAWNQQDPGGAPDVRASVCGVLGWTEHEYTEWLGAGRGQGSGARGQNKSAGAAGVRAGGAGAAGSGSGAAAQAAGDQPGQPEPIGPAPRAGEERKVIANFYWESRYVPDKKGIATQAGVNTEIRKEWSELKALDKARTKDGKDGRDIKDKERFDELVKKFGAEEKRICVAKSIDQIRDEIAVVLNGWPFRVTWGVLFVDCGDGKVRLIEKAIELQALLQEYAVLKFNRGQDDDFTNFVNMEALYESFCGSQFVREWRAVEEYPYEPSIAAHYCTWRAPDYTPTGEYFVHLLKMFNQITDPSSRAIFAAAIATPFWGGPYGKRPAFVFEANKPRSGKTTAASTIAKLCGGPIVINLDRRAEERLKERLLSPEGLTKRVGLVDNLTKTLDSDLMDELVTIEAISGKVLGVGEGSRPNVMTYFITANNVRLSPDFARRCFYVKFDSPDASGKWEVELDAFVREHASKIVADALSILRRPAPAFDWGQVKNEGFPLWVQEVLVRVAGFGPIAEVVGGIGALKIVQKNQERRVEADQDVEDAETFAQGLMERLVGWQGYTKSPLCEILPREPVFIRTTPPPESSRGTMEDIEWRAELKNNLATYYCEIFTRHEVSAKWLKPWLEEHIAAGRIPWMWWNRSATKRGFYIDHKAIVAYCEKQASDASQASAKERAAVTE
jgi:hypothetical protein